MSSFEISNTSLIIHKSGYWNDRGAMIDFDSSLSGVTDFIFDLWRSPKYFYGDIYLVFYNGKKKLYLPCLPLSFVEEYIDKQYSRFYVRFIYQNEKYTFLFSDQKGYALGSYIDTRDKTKNYLTDKVSATDKSDLGGVTESVTITFTCSTYIPQRIGMSYKRYFTLIESSGNTENTLLAELYNDSKTVNIIGGKNSFSETYVLSTSARILILDYPTEEKIKETCDIENVYYIWTIDWSSIAKNFHDTGIALSKYITCSDAIKLLDIEEDTYTIESFYEALTEYITENSYRVVANDFTITDGTYTISVSAGQKIWLCVQGESPTFAKTIRFVSADDDTDYSGTIKQAWSGSQYYNFMVSSGKKTGNTGFANVYTYKTRLGAYANVTSYNVTLSGNIVFE